MDAQSEPEPLESEPEPLQGGIAKFWQGIADLQTRHEKGEPVYRRMADSILRKAGETYEGNIGRV